MNERICVCGHSIDAHPEIEHCYSMFNTELVRETMEADCKRVCEYCQGEVLGFDPEPVQVPDYAQQYSWWHALTEGRRGHNLCAASAIRAAMEKEGQ